MKWRAVIFRAVAVTVVAFLFAVCAIGIYAALQFDGKCGGWMPFLSAAQPCTLSQFVWSSLSLTFLVLLHEYWLIGLLFVGIVLVGSGIFERLRSHQDAV
jgi:hypothetical protein